MPRPVQESAYQRGRSMPLAQQAQVLAQRPCIRRLHKLVCKRLGAGGLGEQVIEHFGRSGGVGPVEVCLAHVARRVGRYPVLRVFHQVHLVEQGLLPGCRTLGPVRSPLGPRAVDGETETRRCARLRLVQHEKAVLFRRQGQQHLGRFPGGEELDARLDLPDGAVLVGHQGNAGVSVAIDRDAYARM